MCSKMYLNWFYYGVFLSTVLNSCWHVGTTMKMALTCNNEFCKCPNSIISVVHFIVSCLIRCLVATPFGLCYALFISFETKQSQPIWLCETNEWSQTTILVQSTLNIYASCWHTAFFDIKTRLSFNINHISIPHHAMQGSVNMEDSKIRVETYVNNPTKFK